MRFVTFEIGGADRFGLQLDDGRILDLQGAYAALLARDIPADRAVALARAITPSEARAFIANGSIALEAARATQRFAEAAGTGLTGPRGEIIVHAAGAVRLKPPVPKPRKFIAAGKN